MKVLNVRNAMMLISLVCLSLSVQAQKIVAPAPSPLQTVTQKFGIGEISIEYSRPAAKGRTVFGGVVPYGKIWRTGANAATKITFSDDVTVEGKAVKAGSYGLYTLPNQGSWEVMLYSDLGLGGNVNDYDASKEVLRVKVGANALPVKLESFTILLDNVLPTSATLILAWENTSVNVRLTTDIDKKVMQSIDESMKNIETSTRSDASEYFKAATYYFENNKDLKQALTWVDKAIDSNPKAYYMVMLKARIEYAMGNKTAGKASAEKTIKLAEEAKSDDFVKMAKELISKN
jgi:hypothetical protein